MATGAPAHHVVSSSTSKSSLPNRLFGWASTKGCTHALKLRHSFKVDSRTRMEIGLDLDVVDQQGLTQLLHSSAPWAAMHYELFEGEPDRGCLEMNPHWVSYNCKYHLGRRGAWWEVPLCAKLGLTYKGKPHVDIGIGNLPLALGLATLLLATGKSLNVHRKEVGSLAVHFPITLGGAKKDHSLQERLEIDASLRAEGKGLRLDFHQLNGVLRLRED